jgi:hypothetical protein
MLSLLARSRSLLRALRRGDALNDDMEAEFRLHMDLRARPCEPAFPGCGRCGHLRRPRDPRA